MFGQLRRALDDVLPALDLRVQDPHRVGFDSRAELVAECAAVTKEVITQGRDEDRARLGVAHRVQQQSHVGESEITVEAGEERDDLDIDVRIIHSQRLDAELPVLAVAPFLGALVPEVRGDVPNLPRRRRPVLHVGPNHRCGSLRPEREPATALVGEFVHLFRDDVGVFADPLEHLDVFEHRCDRQPVSVPASPIGEPSHDLDPTGRFGRQDVVNPFRGTKQIVTGH